MNQGYFLPSPLAKNHHSTKGGVALSSAEDKPDQRQHRTQMNFFYSSLLICRP